MKIQTTQKLLFSLVLSGIGFAAVGLIDASPTQHRPTQLGYGHAPSLTQGVSQGDKPTQLGYGHAPHLPLDKAHKPTQLGYGHAPSPAQGAIQADKQTYRL